MRAVVARDLADVLIEGLSADRRFATAYYAAQHELDRVWNLALSGHLSFSSSVAEFCSRAATITAWLVPVRVGNVLRSARTTRHWRELVHTVATDGSDCG